MDLCMSSTKYYRLLSQKYYFRHIFSLILQCMLYQLELHLSKDSKDCLILSESRISDRNKCYNSNHKLLIAHFTP